jgi:hypothetical protein
MRWVYFIVLAGFAGCGADDGKLFSGAGASSSSSSGNAGAGGASSSTSVSSSSSSSGDAGAGGASSSSTSVSSSASSSGDAGAGGSLSSSSSSSSSSSGAPCVCPPYQECKDGTSTCWGCTKNNTQCLFYTPKIQGVECDTGYVPPVADCQYIGQQPEFPFKPLYCCLPK